MSIPNSNFSTITSEAQYVLIESEILPLAHATEVTEDVYDVSLLRPEAVVETAIDAPKRVRLLAP
jgi:hypothetical protein